jgi:TPR repeat protein
MSLMSLDATKAKVAPDMNLPTSSANPPPEVATPKAKQLRQSESAPPDFCAAAAELLPLRNYVAAEQVALPTFSAGPPPEVTTPKPKAKQSRRTESTPPDFCAAAAELLPLRDYVAAEEYSSLEKQEMLPRPAKRKRTGRHRTQAEKKHSVTIKRIKRCLKKGDAQKMVDLAFILNDGSSDNHAECFTLYYEAAMKDDVIAQFCLGTCYNAGDGVKQNFAEAMKWFKRAAKQGDSDAEFEIGEMFERGRGVKQNYTSAIKWFHKAAGKGLDKAMFSLSVMYKKGLGVNQNDAEATRWYQMGAARGNGGTQYNRGVAHWNGSDGKQNKSEAAEWFRLAAGQAIIGSRIEINAHRALGNIYKRGYDGIQQDLKEALNWYGLAAEKGDTRAQQQLRKIQMAMQNGSDIGDNDRDDDNEEGDLMLFGCFSRD